MNIRKFALGALTAGIMAVAPMASHAGTIQLGFVLDGSGSLGLSAWNTIRAGLAAAILDIPVGGPDTYSISIVSFGSSADTRTDATNVALTDATARSNLSTLIAGLGYLNSGATNFASAFSTMQTALATGAATDIVSSYVNFATDGQQNQGGTGVTERNALIAAGVDNISIEGIGGSVDAGDLQANFCYPQPCDTTVPYNFPAQGFYIGIASAAQYEEAIKLKIRTITQVPEPATLALVGLALMGIGAAKRRKAA